MENDNQNIQNNNPPKNINAENIQSGPIPASDLPKMEATEQSSQASAIPSTPNEVSQPNTANDSNSSKPFSSGNPFENQAKKETAPPPPETVEGEVNVRTMNSDIESIKQTGGEAPQSEVVTAPIINPSNIDDNKSAQSQNEQIATPNDSITPDVEQASAQPAQPEQAQPESNASQPQPQPSKQDSPSYDDNKIPQSSNSVKTILVIIGVIVVALAVGFGVYYLVSSLHKSPQVKDNNTKTSLPVSNKNNPVATTTSTTTPVVSATSTSSTTTASSTSAQQLQSQSFEHKSFISSPTDSVSILLPSVTLNYITPAISSKTVPMLSDGQVRDIAFTTGPTSTSSVSVTSAEILKAYFPNLSEKISPFFTKDFTAWIYYDNINKITPKFGLMFKLADGVSLDTVSSSVSEIENVPDRIAKLFIQNVTTPPSKDFADGKIMSVNIRFLRFSAGNVFEYGWLKNANGTFLIMGTSYKQMLDIISKLSQTSAK